MRVLALSISILLGASFVMVAQGRKPKVAIPRIQPADEKDRPTSTVAGQLTFGLRTAARPDMPLTAASIDLSLADLKAQYKCESEAPACMAAIGAALGADVMLRQGRAEELARRLRHHAPAPRCAHEEAR